jgi:eukaryotic-like serine/threonine-protein kinase
VLSNDYNATLFGVNPSAVAGSEATMRQLTVDEGDRAVRTQNRPPVAWIWAGVACMIAIIAAVIFWTFSLQPQQLSQNLSVAVPDVIGQTYENGEVVLTDNRLEAQRFEEASATVEAGVILRTDPEAGIDVEPDSEVRVWVSSGPPQAAVPDVTRMLEADAIAALTARGFEGGSVSSTYSPDLAAGQVISTDPAAGSNLSQGSAVNLVVSNGLVQVPDVAGFTVADANNTLSDLLLTVSVQSDLSCTGGAVYGQSAVGDVAQKSPVTIRVCAGSPPPATNTPAPPSSP